VDAVQAGSDTFKAPLVFAAWPIHGDLHIGPRE
jgi:hypothetical protein